MQVRTGRRKGIERGRGRRERETGAERGSGFGQNNVLDHEEEEATVQKGAADRTSSKKSQQPSTPSKSLKSSADRHSKVTPSFSLPSLSVFLPLPRCSVVSAGQETRALRREDQA
eukprot:752470-Hanusia_phi.AAC.1